MAAFGDQSAKALAFIAEGDKILGKWLGSRQSKQEDAAELYGKAANCYKVSQKWKDAGDTYSKAADMHQKSGSQFEAASSYSEAGKAHKRVDPVAAITAFRHAISLYSDAGRFMSAAKLQVEVADIFKEDGNTAGAIESYQAAADFYAGENNKQHSNKCLREIAMLRSTGEPPDYLGAADIFEQLGRSDVQEPLLRMNAKGNFLQAAFCLLAAGDSVAVRQKLDAFKGMDYTFDGSREGNLVEALVTAYESGDGEAFSQAAFEFDQITKLDPWKTSLLLVCKRAIEGGGGGDVGGDDVDLT